LGIGFVNRSGRLNMVQGHRQLQAKIGFVRFDKIHLYGGSENPSQPQYFFDRLLNFFKISFNQQVFYAQLP